MWKFLVWLRVVVGVVGWIVLEVVLVFGFGFLEWVGFVVFCYDFVWLEV